MKTTIGSAILITIILVGALFRVDHATAPETEYVSSTQSVLEAQDRIIICPLSEGLRTGNKPIFSYRNENTGYPLQEHMEAINVVAHITNEKATCKYYGIQTTKIFSVILPGDYSECLYENDAYAGFICPN